MTAILKVDTIQDTSGNNIINESSDTITIGASGDTTNIVGTLQNNGAVLAFGSSDAFHVYDMSGGNASGTLVLTSELLDDGSNYNTSNGRYTAPSAGKYHFYCSAIAAANADSYINFHLNGSSINGGTDQGGNTPNTNTQGIMMATINLSAGDYITMVSQNNVYNNYIFFGGYKLY